MYPWAPEAREQTCYQGAVSFYSECRGGRIFGEVSDILTLFYWVIKQFLQSHVGVSNFLITFLP